MLWDPLGFWPGQRRWIWATLAVSIGLFRGPKFIRNIRPGNWELRGSYPDFAQEWFSARNYFESFPIYAELAVAAERYGLGRLNPSRNLIIINAHPPSSVLLALPLARLDFETAFIAWNLASLLLLALSTWLVGRGLRIPFPAWSVFPATVLLLLCDPLYQQIHQGQLNLVLLALLCGTWAAERAGRPRLAGVLIGAATAIKILPAFLLAYYVLRRRWLIVVSGAISLGLVTGLTAAIFGLDAYRSYIQLAVPEIYWFRVAWNNNSLAGFWCRLFDTLPWKERYLWRSDPLWYSPALAHVGYWASAAVVAAVTAGAARRARSQDDDDRAFGLAITAMLLVSPLVWEHYFVLLLIPLAVCWRDITPRRATGWLFGIVVLGIWLRPTVVWALTGGEGRVARPLENLTVISYQFYALLALFVLSVVGFNQGARGARVDQTGLGGRSR